jgi:hypothetical protein
MEYLITPSRDGTFIILRVKGNISRQTAMQLNQEAQELGKQLQVKHYLVDVTAAKFTETTIATYELAYSDLRAPKGLAADSRVAILVHPKDESHDFLETVTRNADFSVKKFADPDQARRFLSRELAP